MLNKIIILESELTWQFVRASGPGGQNVNKVSTAAQLHFNITGSNSLTAEVKQRLLVIAKNRVNKLGELVITAQTQRTQQANRAEALAKLAKLIERAQQIPKKRIKTKPSRATIERGQATKKLHSQKKQQRKKIFE